MPRFWLFNAAACLAASGAPAQDLIKVDPQHARVEFENDQVRAVRERYAPGEVAPTHTHPTRVSIWITDAKVKITYPDGKTELSSFKAGQVVWGEPRGQHTGGNAGEKLFETVVVELKAPSPGTGSATGDPALDPVNLDPQHARIELENDRVRVVRVHLGPGEKIPMHQRRAHLDVWLTDGDVKITSANGTTNVRKQKAGELRWAAGEKHATENVGDYPWS